MQEWWLRRRAPLALALACAALAPGAAHAQRLLDWPIRLDAGAEAVMPGAAAAFWNPAAGGLLDGRAEAFALNIRGPRATELDGIAIAGAARLENGLVLSAGAAHVGVDGIRRTTTSPDDGADIDVSETLVTISAAHPLGSTLWIGASGRYARASAALDGRSQSGLGAGVLWRPALPFAPAVGASVLSRDGSAEWSFGARVAALSLPRVSPETLRLQVSYGASGAGDGPGVSHRAALEAEWARRLSISAGLAAEPGAAGHEWVPVAAAGLRLGRYTLAVLRDAMPNEFGATYTYLLRARF